MRHIVFVQIVRIVAQMMIQAVGDRNVVIIVTIQVFIVLLILRMRPPNQLVRIVPERRQHINVRRDMGQ